MADTILVKSALKAREDGGAEVALWEVDEAHPGGEAYIAGDKLVEVAETAGVMGALRDGKLVKVAAEAPDKAEKPAK